jgi:hypothetical protein
MKRPWPHSRLCDNEKLSARSATSLIYAIGVNHARLAANASTKECDSESIT